MKYLLASLLILSLVFGCSDDDATQLTCPGAVKTGDNFVLGDKAITVLELHSDLGCACCDVCNCIDAPFATLLVEGDTVMVGGIEPETNVIFRTGEHEGRTIRLEELEDGSCESPFAPEDYAACFSID